MSASSRRHDAIVVGGGHNGLVAACYLARAGQRVLVLERSDRVGGAAVSRELHRGWVYSSCSYVCSLLRPEIIRGLDLPRYGLQIIPYEGSITLTRDGDYLASRADPDLNRREIARHSPRDAEAYARFSRDVARHVRLVKPLLMRTPPDPASSRPRDLAELAWLLGRAWDLGERQLHETIAFFTLSAAEYLERYFESELVKAHLVTGAIIGTGLGPCSPGSAYVLLHHRMGEVDGHLGAWGFARGGMGAVSESLRACLAAHGGAVRTDAEVAALDVRDGRAQGVVLASGERLAARVVLSSLDVKRTMLGLVEPRALPDAFLAAVRRVRTRGSSGKLNIALDARPRFPAVPEDHPCLGREMHVVDSVERLERAYDDWKAGRWSRDPFLDCLVPSLIDRTMAPTGKHMMSVFVQYAPPRLADGPRGEKPSGGKPSAGKPWDGAAREAFGRTVIEQIARHSPGFESLVRHVEIRTPDDLEREVGLTEGNIFQGELTLDQLFFNRPVPGWGAYRMPLRGLYLCGSSTHPGGGVMGAPGANAAREVLRDLGWMARGARRAARSMRSGAAEAWRDTARR